MSRQLNLNPTYTRPPHPPFSSASFFPPTPSSVTVTSRNMKQRPLIRWSQLRAARICVLTPSEMSRQSCRRKSRGQKSRRRGAWDFLADTAVQKQPSLFGLLSFYHVSVQQQTFTHVYTSGQTHTAHLHPALRSPFSFCCLYLKPMLSVLSFLIICLLLPSLFQYPLSFSWLHMQSASPLSPLLPFPLSILLPLHLLSLSLFSVCWAGGHYLSHSGHVR